MSQNRQDPNRHDYDISQPLLLLTVTTVDGWMDFNGHMNVASYVHLFDRAMDRFLAFVNLGQAWVQSANGSIFALQNHIHYLREVRLDQKLSISLQLLDMDDKRLHLFFRMMDVETNRMVAASELLSIYVDMDSRTSAAFPSEQKSHLKAILDQHLSLTRPRVAGHKIGTSAKLKL